jgi:phage baseplate assembly protein gpV
MARVMGRVLLGLTIFVVVVYAIDWAVWKVRVARGGGMGSVQVSWLQVAELKGGREQFYPDGQGTVACSQSVFPQGGNSPCWYVVKHPVVIEH